MKIWNRNKAIAWLLVLLVSSCVEPYTPDVLEAPNSFLVVNGLINTNGPTRIQLLRTQNLTEIAPPPAETGAVVVIEAETGENYRVAEMGEGEYTSDALDLNPAVKHRLFIKTADGKEYASDFVEVKRTPAIDAVTWAPVDNQVQLYVSTHDPENDTRYYRWEYEETWQYRSAFYTYLKYEDEEVLYRDSNDEEIFSCWRSGYSNTIELSNTVKLSQDVISNYKLLAIPYNVERVSVKYSILVKQFALTREAYEYWETLKRNTESIGTLFDALPSQLNSNIRCLSDPQELVVGYISASSVQEKRIFISPRDFPKEWRTYVPYCRADTLWLADGNVVDYFSGGNSMPVGEIYAPLGPTLLGYTFASTACVDCRTRGTNVQPDFWE